MNGPRGILSPFLLLLLVGTCSGGSLPIELIQTAGETARRELSMLPQATQPAPVIWWRSPWTQHITPYDWPPPEVGGETPFEIQGRHIFRPDGTMRVTDIEVRATQLFTSAQRQNIPAVVTEIEVDGIETYFRGIMTLPATGYWEFYAAATSDAGISRSDPVVYIPEPSSSVALLSLGLLAFRRRARGLA